VSQQGKGQSRLERTFQSALAAHQSARLNEASELYEQILRLDRRHFPALLLLGAVKAQQADYAAAERLTRDALRVQPRDLRALLQHGNVLLAQQRYDDAFAAFGDAMAVNPSMPEVHVNRGAILMLRKQAAEALACFDAALRIAPRFAPALCNRGNALQELNRLDDALAAYDAAVREQAGNAEYLASRANCLHRLKRDDMALEDIDAALKAQPSNADFHYNRGNILAALKKPAEAFAAFDAAWRIAPDLPYAEGDRLYAKLAICDWSDLARELDHVAANVGQGRTAARPFAFLAMSGTSSLQAQCAKLFIAREFPNRPALWHGEAYDHARLRIAYLSADFRDHPVALLMAGVFERHDRANFEISAYSFGPAGASSMRRRLESAFDRFLDVRAKSDVEIAALLREHEIDVAVDLMGPTQLARPGILAHRPAPVQILYLGYAGSSGAPYIDYVLADRTVLPEAQRACYAETVLDLPHCFMATDSARTIAPETPSRADEGLPAEGFVFCAFSNSYKILPDVFAVWMDLLRERPDSVLWLASANAAATANLRAAAAAHGIAAERLVFARRVESNGLHLARHRLADLFLDTVPFGAHSTSCDALWAGLPVLTCMGEGFAGRVAASLLATLGVPELITASLADYRAQALALSGSRERLAAVRSKIVQARETSPLFDTARFTRDLEALYLAATGRAKVRD